MNEFPVNNDHRQGKEKNMYILHLDTPRIIIITSIFIGLIILSVLTGMNINRESREESDLFSNENALLKSLSMENETPASIENESGVSAVEQGIIISDPDKEHGISSAPSNISQAPAIEKPLLKDPLFEKPGLKTAEKEKPKSDILTSENIESILPAVKEAAREKPKRVVKKPDRKPAKKESVKKEKVVEVAVKKEQKFSPPAADKEYYAIQVASFDKKSRADNVVDDLEKKKFNAYITSGMVNGKNYYRVRIGPIFSKKKACRLLDEIHYDSEYRGSYMVKE